MQLDQRSGALGEFLTQEQPDLLEGLLVRLAFGPETDLDLYVTGPDLETVYFANKESKSGGKISKDGRCGGANFQIEEVQYVIPKTGRYRVGIDFPESCSGVKDPAAYSVHVTYKGKRLKVSGAVLLQKFEVIVLEFEIDAADMKEVAE